MRLDRYLCGSTGDSRSTVRTWIRAGRVTRNGTVATRPAEPVSNGDCVSLDGTVLVLRGPRYLMVNKPVGTVCTAAHADPRSVLNCVPIQAGARLQCVGRLDIDTTGLLLLSDDGQWNHRVSRPGRSTKVYRVALAAAWTDQMLDHLCTGVQLRGERRLAVACDVTPLGPDSLRVTLDEGRYHQIKRMLAAVGNRVVGLHRLSVGALALDDSLAPGAWRELTEIERCRAEGLDEAACQARSDPQ
ncbi:MAG: pseudouridine synthase [Pseudomonadota bacterium]